jgi:hypothetical protein
MTNERLLAAMEAVRTDRGPETMRELFDALGQSRLVLPVRGGGDKGVEIAVMEQPDGATTFVAFTDPKALAAFAGEDARYVDMDARQLADVVLSDPSATLLVESGRETGGRLSRGDLQLLRDRLAPRDSHTFAPTDDGGLRLFNLSLPVSDALVQAVVQDCERHPAVREAYICEGAFGDGPRHLLLGLRFDPAAEDDEQAAARSALAAAAQPALGPGELLDVIGLLPAMLEPVTALCRRVWP